MLAQSELKGQYDEAIAYLDAEIAECMRGEPMRNENRLRKLEEISSRWEELEPGRHPSTMILSNESPDTALVIFSDGNVETVTHTQAEAMRFYGKMPTVISTVSDECASGLIRVLQGEIT